VNRYACCDPRRLAAVKVAGVLNGIEYLEVSDTDAPSHELRQRTLFVRLLAPDPTLTSGQVTITGGDRIAEVGVVWVAPATSLPAGEDPALVAHLRDLETILVVRTDGRGDLSTYRFSVVAAAGTDVPPAGWDPMLTTVPFSFKVECTSDADCRVHVSCPPAIVDAPTIDYRAKDWDSFRRLVLDRMSLLSPGWRERNPADLGVTLVEVLAWLGDELSWRQDAVATEAWLATARRRTSLRRHTRLVDYRVHEGSNARVWVRFVVSGAGAVIPAGTQVLTRVPGLPEVLEPGGPDHRAALSAGAETFETMEDLVAYASHDVLDLWTWGDTGCCLPTGATSATLVGHHPRLKAGDLLALEEVVGPRTGKRADADPAHRWVVRLTHVRSTSDPSGGRFADPPSDDPVDVTEIAWHADDALPFPLCLSVAAVPGVAISRASGNVVLADHGRTVVDEALGEVPDPVLTLAVPTSDRCRPTPAPAVPARFRPRLDAQPLTFAATPPVTFASQGPSPAGVLGDLAGGTFGTALESFLRARGVRFTAGPAVVRGGDGVWSVSDGASVAVLREVDGTLALTTQPPAARASQAPDAASTVPALTVTGTSVTGTTRWHPRYDLLGSDGDALHLTVEVEHDRTASLRFGDGVHGRRPEPGTSFTATYRVGDGPAGNVGARTLAHVVTASTAVDGVDNPVAASGGSPPEPADAIRRDAPDAFLVQQRAVTADDYATTASRHPRVQRANATFRWTGSWHTVFVTADRFGGGAVDRPLAAEVRDHLEPYRMAGYDLAVDGPRYVSLDVGLFVCADREHFRADVHAAVLDALGSGRRRDGGLGRFHPDRFTFEQPVHLSSIVAVVQTVAGVSSVTVTRFGRFHEPGVSAIDDGVIRLGRLEIARLDADPNHPEHGRLEVTMGGGK
jgi:hypothetical protein